MSVALHIGASHVPLFLNASSDKLWQIKTADASGLSSALWPKASLATDWTLLVCVKGKLVHCHAGEC